jgi:hypothetical protein
VNSKWKRAATVLGAAVLLAPPIAGLLTFMTRLGLGWWSNGDGSTDLVGIAGTHVLLSYVFGIVPALATGLILSLVVWRRGTFSAPLAIAVSALCALVYCLAVSIIFRGGLVRVMTLNLALWVIFLAVATALIVRALLRWARFI